MLFFVVLGTPATLIAGLFTIQSEYMLFQIVGLVLTVASIFLVCILGVNVYETLNSLFQHAFGKSQPGGEGEDERDVRPETAESAETETSVVVASGGVACSWSAYQSLSSECSSCSDRVRDNLRHLWIEFRRPLTCCGGSVAVCVSK